LKRNNWTRNNVPRPTHIFCGKCNHVVKVADKCELCEAELALERQQIDVQNPEDPARIQHEAFEIASRPTVAWNQLNNQRYNIIDRVRERMRADLTEQELEEARERLSQYAEGRPALRWTDEEE